MRTLLAIVAFAVLLESSAALAQPAPPPLFVVHFQTGPAWVASAAPAEQPAFKEHSANLSRLRKEGIIAFGARYGEFGMIFVKADSLDAAKAIIDADPGVRAGTFVYRIDELSVFYPWQA